MFCKGKTVPGVMIATLGVDIGGGWVIALQGKRHHMRPNVPVERLPKILPHHQPIKSVRSNRVVVPHESNL
jgi:hypothetical protein